MDGMTINHIVSIDHGSRVNNVQVEWRDRRSTSVTPSHHQKHHIATLRGYFVIFHKATRCYKKPRENWGLRTWFQIYQHQFGKAPFRIRKCMALFAANAQQSREVTCGHGFPRLPAACRKCLTPSTPRRARLVNHPAPGRGVRLASKCLLCKTPVWPKRRASGGLQKRNSRHLYPLMIFFTAKGFTVLKDPWPTWSNM